MAEKKHCSSAPPDDHEWAISETRIFQAAQKMSNVTCETKTTMLKESLMNLKSYQLPRALQRVSACCSNFTALVKCLCSVCSPQTAGVREKKTLNTYRKKATAVWHVPFLPY